MIREKMYRQIQTFKRQGHSKGKIAKAMGLDPKTVAKYYSMGEKDFRCYLQQHMFRDKRLEAYERDILEVYGKNEFKRLNMSSVYDYLEERYGRLAGNEQTLRNYIHYLIQTDKLRLEERLRTYTKVPELPFGRQMQLDFGRYRCRSGLKLFIFAAVLSASRYKYVIFQDHPFKTSEVIDHLLSCFDYFGGMPEEIVIDQDRLLVVSENAGDILFTNDFRYFIEEQELRMYVCRKDDPETKGKVENMIKYIKGNFFGTRDFSNVDAANTSVLKWMGRRANGKISQATKQIPVVLIANERECLRPVRTSIFRKDSLIGREERNVNDKDCISVNASGYQLPSKYRNKSVEVYITKHKLFVFDIYTGNEIVEYDLSPIPGKIISKREYRRENETTLRELKERVLGMFSDANWKRFVEMNFQAFPRYVRDQCVEAKRYFEVKDINPFILERALEYCLENNTPSFADLNDTYEYFKREDERADLEIPALSLGYQGHHEPLRVSARALSVYREIIGNRGAADESL
jgi:transposase